MRVDAVIVLSHEMSRDAVLSSESVARCSLASRLFRELDASFIVTSGWNYRPDCEVPIALAVRRKLEEAHSLESSRILADTSARDTVGDAYFTKVNLALAYNWRKIAIVTSDYHIYRTQIIFEFIYGLRFNLVFFGAPIKACEEKVKHEAASLEAFRRTFASVMSGDDPAILKAMRLHHPFYNGAAHPQLDLCP